VLPPLVAGFTVAGLALLLLAEPRTGRRVRWRHANRP
jgi:hypothetical protein